jgi:site-specific recombinase XerD
LENFSLLNSEHYRENTKQSQSVLRFQPPRRWSSKPQGINTVFNEACSLAGVEGHTPHDARQAMGRHLIEKTGNIAAVQRQLGHTNAAYSIQYARVTDQELADALDDR